MVDAETQRLYLQLLQDAKAMSDTAYSSAIVHCLDRGTGETKTFMLYSITKIELKVFTGTGVETSKVFIVKEAQPGFKTEWIEESK